MDVEKGRRATFASIGNTGLKRQGGLIFEEFLPKLHGKKAIKVYDEMSSNDPVIGGCLLAINQMVRQAEWSVVPGDDSPEGIRAAMIVETSMKDMEDSWNSLVIESLSMIPYGFSLQEVVYKKRNGNPSDPVKGSAFSDGMIGWKCISPRSQDTIWEWVFDETGRVTGAVQQSPPDYKTRNLPMWKCLLFKAGGYKGNPEGKSSLRTAYRPWYIKKGIEEIEAMGIERDLVGIPKAYVPARFLADDASEAEKATLASVEKLIKDLRADKNNGIIIPSLFDESGNRIFEIELMSSRGRRSHDTNAIINRYNKMIASSMLADFILIGHENVGSFALASSKTHLFSVAVGGYLDVFTETFNKHEIPRLLRYNGMKDYPLPSIVHTDIETLDLDELARYVSSLTSAEISLEGKDVENYLRSQAGIPHNDNEDIDDEEEDDEDDVEDFD